jgi:hypothetical protein
MFEPGFYLLIQCLNTVLSKTNKIKMKQYDLIAETRNDGCSEYQRTTK